MKALVGAGCQAAKCVQGGSEPLWVVATPTCWQEAIALLARCKIAERFAVGCVFCLSLMLIL